MKYYIRSDNEVFYKWDSTAQVLTVIRGPLPGTKFPYKQSHIDEFIARKMMFETDADERLLVSGNRRDEAISK